MVAFPSMSFLPAVVLSLSLSTLALAGVHDAPRRRHAGTNFLMQNHTLSKRYDNARFSYYEAGKGACGATNSDSDYIVALNSAQFDAGSHCFASITITYNGKSTQAQITDECPGCPFGGLDLTPGLFSYFASTDEGIIYGSWDFSDGAAPAPSPTPTPTPTPTPVWTPPVIVVTTPTSTWSPPPPPPPPSTSSTKEHKTSSSTTSSTPIPSSSSTTSAPPSSSLNPPSSSSASSTSSSAAASPTGNLYQLNSAVLQLAGLAAAAEQH